MLRAIAVVAGLALGAGVASAHDENAVGAAGLLSKKNRGDIPELVLSAGTPLLESGKIELKSGTYYELEIKADGSQELALAGSGFFRAIWIDEIVVEGLEIRPLGLDSVEFDEAGNQIIALAIGTRRCAAAKAVNLAALDRYVAVNHRIRRNQLNVR